MSDCSIVTADFDDITTDDDVLVAAADQAPCEPTFPNGALVIGLTLVHITPRA